MFFDLGIGMLDLDCFFDLIVSFDKGLVNIW